ncbi:MAG: hypothetical protein FJZ90_15245 [Chloroflexi bacterium]|nr:hypothetical protein [Chloroflexota bacterium]
MLTDHDLLLLLTGAAIALVSAVVTALVQHILSLREDKIKRGRDEQARNIARLTAIPQGLTQKITKITGARREIPPDITLQFPEKIALMRAGEKIKISKELIRALEAFSEALITEQPEAKEKPQDESIQAESPGAETPSAGEEGK